jgi:hypothetical protein
MSANRKKGRLEFFRMVATVGWWLVHYGARKTAEIVDYGRYPYWRNARDQGRMY